MITKTFRDGTLRSGKSKIHHVLIEKLEYNVLFVTFSLEVIPEVTARVRKYFTFPESKVL